MVVGPLLIIGLLIFAGFYTGGAFNGSSVSFVENHQITLASTGTQPIGPGFSNAGAFSFTVPSNATAAWVNGSYSVPSCTSVYYCLVYVEIVTPASWVAIQNGEQAGLKVPVVWCDLQGGSCLPQTSGSISSGDLVAAGYGGMPLDLVIYSGSAVFSQTYSAMATLSWNTPP
jgi:hypothetical protein